MQQSFDGYREQQCEESPQKEWMLHKGGARATKVPLDKVDTPTQKDDSCETDLGP
ncbi:MAG: hypothetical protein ACYS9X_06140 [Planctomycetota bacterium]